MSLSVMADREITPAGRKAQEMSDEVIATGDLDEPSEGVHLLNIKSSATVP